MYLNGNSGSIWLHRHQSYFEVVRISNFDNPHFQEAVLDNVLYARAYTSEQQMELLDYVAAKFHEEPNIFKLLIVDSIMALFRWQKGLLNKSDK